MMLNRSNDVELDFDFDKEKTKDNQLLCSICFARINSIIRTLNMSLDDKIVLSLNHFLQINMKKKF